MTVHTILLVQPHAQPSTRTYYDFEKISAAMDHIAGLFEQQLQRENPRLGQIQYRAEDLFRFIDGYKEFVALVFDPATKNYQPHDKQWIKDRLISHFSRQTNQPSQPSYHQPQSRHHGNRRW